MKRYFLLLLAIIAATTAAVYDLLRDDQEGALDRTIVGEATTTSKPRRDPETEEDRRLLASTQPESAVGRDRDITLSLDGSSIGRRLSWCFLGPPAIGRWSDVGNGWSCEHEVVARAGVESATATTIVNLPRGTGAVLIFIDQHLVEARTITEVEESIEIAVGTPSAHASEGIVEDSAGMPLGGVIVKCSIEKRAPADTSERISISTPSEDNGRFRLVPNACALDQDYQCALTLSSLGKSTLVVPDLAAHRRRDKDGRPIFRLSPSTELTIDVRPSFGATLPDYVEGRVFFASIANERTFRASIGQPARLTDVPDDDRVIVSLTTPGFHIAIPETASLKDGRMPTLDVAEEGSERRLTVFLAADLCLRGRVEDGMTRLPVAGCRLLVRASGDPRIAEQRIVPTIDERRITSDPDGKFVVDRVRPDFLAIESDDPRWFFDLRGQGSRYAIADPFRSLRERGSVDEIRNTADGRRMFVDIKDGRDPTDLVIVVTKGGGIRGIVRNPADQPVAGAVVTAELSGWSETADGRAVDYARRFEARSSDDGTFEFSGLDPGEWRVRAGFLGYADASIGPIKIDAGAPTEVTLRFEAPIAVEVHVACDEQFRRFELAVEIYELRNPIVFPLRMKAAEGRTDGDGKVRLSPLRRGRYRVQLCGLTERGSVAVGPAWRDIAIGDENPPTVEFAVKAGLRWTAEILDQRDRPIVGAILTLLPRGSPPETALTVNSDDSGRVDVLLPDASPYEIKELWIPVQPGSSRTLGYRAEVLTGNPLTPAADMGRIVARTLD